MWRDKPFLKEHRFHLNPWPLLRLFPTFRFIGKAPLKLCLLFLKLPCKWYAEKSEVPILSELFFIVWTAWFCWLKDQMLCSQMVLILYSCVHTSDVDIVFHFPLHLKMTGSNWQYGIHIETFALWKLAIAQNYFVLLTPVHCPRCLISLFLFVLSHMCFQN